jgi:site-specific DNA recombinase
MTNVPPRDGPTDLNQVPTDADPDDSVSVAAIYARTSESKPDFHYSIKEQVSRCWERCEQQGWEVRFVFTDDGESGKNTDRPEFQDMLDSVTAEMFDVVVFWKLDRFCRSLTDLVKTEEKLDEHGVALHSVTEFIDTSSPVGRFNFRNLASAAELESDLTSQRVQIGMHGMAKEHRWPNDQPPYGYELTEDRRLEIVDSEAAIVKNIYRRYLKDRSMNEVASWLNQEYSSKKDGEWCRSSVRKILTNEIYQGQYQLGEYEDYVKEYQIVSDELYEKAKETRYRFKQSKTPMDSDLKEAKAKKVLSRFKRDRAEESSD